MKLTEHTLTVLKNFASIQPNLVLAGDTRIRTVSEAKSIIAVATIESVPENEIGIYDLNEFLGTLSLVSNPQLDFKKDHVIISDSSGLSRTKFFFSNPEMLTYPKREVTIPSEDIKFTLTQDTLNKLKKAASTLSYEKIMISNKGNLLQLSVSDDLSNKTANVFSIDVAGEFEPSAKFNMIFEIANMKILPGDYDVSISEKLVSSFKSKGTGVDYLIVLKSESSYV